MSDPSTIALNRVSVTAYSQAAARPDVDAKVLSLLQALGASPQDATTYLSKLQSQSPETYSFLQKLASNYGITLSRTSDGNAQLYLLAKGSQPIALTITANGNESAVKLLTELLQQRGSLPNDLSNPSALAPNQFCTSQFSVTIKNNSDNKAFLAFLSQPRNLQVSVSSAPNPNTSNIDWNQVRKYTELGISMIPILGASVDVKDIAEQFYNAFSGKDVDQLTLNLSFIGILAQFVPELNTEYHAFEGLVKQLPQELRPLVTDAVIALAKSKNGEHINGIVSSMARYVAAKAGSTEQMGELMRLKDLVHASTFKFDMASLAGNEKLLADNLNKNVFQTLEDFYFALRKHPAELGAKEVEEIKRLRESLFGIKDGEQLVMVKVLPIEAKNIKGSVSTFVIRKSDLTGVKTPQDLINRLRLDYPNTEFSNGNLNVSFAEFKADIGSVITPYRPEGFGGTIKPQTDSYPYLGNGFIPNNDGRIIPEYYLRRPEFNYTTMGFDDFVKGL